MERKLASIRKVKELKPIEGADKIELAVIDGWQCVVKKGEFYPGNLGVYFEIDSFLPCAEPFLFLEPRGRKTNEDGSEGYRIKTMKLRGQLSQGLLLPFSVFSGYHQLLFQELAEHEDVTTPLNIKKYEKPIPAQLRGQVKGDFPWYIRKTDEERIQNLPEYFELYKEDHFEETEKIDGSSMTAYFHDGDFGVCSRNIDLKETEHNAYWEMANELRLKEAMYHIGKTFDLKNIALQGELAGEGIQSNRLKLTGHKFFLYKIWNIDTQQFLNPFERMKIFWELSNVLNNENFKHVPILKDKTRTFVDVVNMQQILEYANGKSRVNDRVLREGIVFKSYEHPEISFKAISNNYLLGEGE